MSRPRSTIPGMKRNIWLPITLWAEIDLFLYSPLEGKTPYGAAAEFFEAAVVRYLTYLKGLKDDGNRPDLPSD